jgi:hypothetical protein
MSSETSTETVRLGADTADRSVRLQPDHVRGRADDTLQPWQLFTLAGLIGATVVVFVSTGQTPAGIILLSLTIFTAAVVGVAAWRTLAPLIGRDEPIGAQVLGGRTRAALEREKTLVLRSIKELEFDHAMRKISDKDFAEMSTRLRSRAAGLIRQLDAGSAYREEIEKEIAKRVGRSSSGAPGEPVARALPGSRGEPGKARPTRVCLGCRTENDPDARFCKSCGSKLEATS